jgi:hypothetical protein
VRADGRGGGRGGEGGVGDVEGGFGSVVEQAGGGAAGEHAALDLDDGGDVRLPVEVGQFAGGIKDGDGAAFIAIAPLVVMAVGAIVRRAGGGDALGGLAQGRLVVLELDDQAEAGLGGDLEVFF